MPDREPAPVWKTYHYYRKNARRKRLARGASVGKSQDVVVETVFLVPHAVGPVHGPGDIAVM